MGAMRFFIGARGMCRLLGTSVGRLGTQAVAPCWSRLLVLGGAAAARSLLRCSRGSCLSSIRGPCLVGPRGWSFPLCKCILLLHSWLSDRRHLHQGRGRGGGAARCRLDSAPPTVKSAK
ncbi:hypothetical protein BHM03_00003234 [Ensete ventricosum]|nr:hypothetical protein BHM03_00003234 [Ensete ventricosum]